MFLLIRCSRRRSSLTHRKHDSDIDALHGHGFPCDRWHFLNLPRNHTAGLLYVVSRQMKATTGGDSCRRFSTLPCVLATAGSSCPATHSPRPPSEARHRETTQIPRDWPQQPQSWRGFQLTDPIASTVFSNVVVEVHNTPQRYRRQPVLPFPNLFNPDHFHVRYSCQPCAHASRWNHANLPAPKLSKKWFA
jgi:hypothetical protein